MSKYTIGFRQHASIYLIDTISETEMKKCFIEQTNWDLEKANSYVISCSSALENKIFDIKMHKGFYGTAGGFLWSQGRGFTFGYSRFDLNSDAF
jgi:uridine phosphorylase